MCNPVLAVTIASAAFSAHQSIQQSNYQSDVNEYNARVAENEAQETRNVGVEEENAQRRKTAELLSKQRAQLGASNVDLGSGSALQLQEDTVTLGEADALRIRSNYENQAKSLESSAGLTSGKADAAKTAGASGAFSSLLGGAAGAAKSGVADKWFTQDSAAVAGTVDQNVGWTANGQGSIF